MFETMPQFYSDGVRRYLHDSTARAIAVADVVLAVSEVTRAETIKHWHPSAPVRVTPLAPHIRPDQISDEPPLGGPYLLYAGGSHRRKRLDLLIKAFGLAMAGGLIDQQTKLVIVNGAGDDYSRGLREASSVADRIELTGWIPDAELATWFGQAEAFVYPSDYEGFGLGPLEAMACGTPVISYRNSALAEVLGEAAHFVEPGSAAALAQAIERVLLEPDHRAELTAAGLDRAAGFSWSATAAGTTAALREAIQRCATLPQPHDFGV